MILVDTSIWIDYLRRDSDAISAFLTDESILVHEFVVGELALGSIRNRATVVNSLLAMPQAQTATDTEVRAMIDAHALHGSGIGYIDAHLLASALLVQASLLTLDKRLAVIAQRLGVAMPIS